MRVPETQEGLSSQDTPSPRRQFDVNDTVFANNYAAGPKWMPGVVVDFKGRLCCLRDNREIVRHVDQLLIRESARRLQEGVKGYHGTWGVQAEQKS